MSNRLLRDSICVSDTVDKLTWLEEVFFYRLIVNCDDFGRCDGRAAIIKARLFPLKNITVSDIEKTLSKLSAVGLVYRYVVNDKPYLQLVTWEKYQQIRNKKSKYPAPEEGDAIDDWWELKDNCLYLKSNADKLQTNVPVIQSNPIQSESKSKFESDNMHGAVKTASEPVETPVISLPLNDNSIYGIAQEHIDHWKELYPAVNVLLELKKMQGWLESNPNKRKTKRGIARFITNWLARTQDKGGVSYGTVGNFANGEGKKPQFGDVV